VFELSVGNKKELQVAETPLLECSKLLKIAFGIPDKLDIRTYKSLLSNIDLEELKSFHKTILRMTEQR